MKIIDLAGQRFGKLLVVGRSSNTSRVYFDVVCDCGVKKSVQSRHLRSGAVVSCGCHRRELSTSHGMYRTRPYRIWRGIIERCTNSSRPEYSSYGGRGIKVCERWHAFLNFWEDMKHRYADNLSIDRIDNDGDYEPSNCRWATHKEQARNTSRNRLVDLDGKKVCIAEAAEVTGVNRFALRQRAANGETGDRLFAKRIASGRRKAGQQRRPVVETADTAAKAVALAVIKHHEGSKT